MSYYNIKLILTNRKTIDMIVWNTYLVAMLVAYLSKTNYNRI